MLLVVFSDSDFFIKMKLYFYSAQFFRQTYRVLKGTFYTCTHQMIDISLVVACYTTLNVPYRVATYMKNLSKTALPISGGES